MPTTSTATTSSSTSAATAGWFISRDAKGTPAYQPYWHHAIKAAARVAVAHTVLAIGRQSDTWPLAVSNIDALLYGSDERDPAAFASLARVILDDDGIAAAMAAAAAERARGYTWSIAAGRLRRLYSDLTSRQLVECQ